MARIIITPDGIRFEGKNFEQFAAQPAPARKAPAAVRPVPALVATIAPNGVVEAVRRLN